MDRISNTAYNLIDLSQLETVRHCFLEMEFRQITVNSMKFRHFCDSVQDSVIVETVGALQYDRLEKGLLQHL